MALYIKGGSVAISRGIELEAEAVCKVFILRSFKVQPDVLLAVYVDYTLEGGVCLHTLGCVCMLEATLASFPGLLCLQFLITCSAIKGGRTPGEFHHVIHSTTIIHCHTSLQQQSDA